MVRDVREGTGGVAAPSLEAVAADLGNTVLVAGIGVVYLVLWGMCFVVVALRDENANHWDWPTDHGPSALVNVKLAAVSALLAGLVLGVLFGFGEFVKYLAGL